MYFTSLPIYQLWQRLNICREQFLNTAILQNLAYDGEVVRKALQILLLGRELLGLCHLGLRRNAQLRKEHLTQLA